MTLPAALRRILFLAGCCFLWGGCLPDSDSPMDEKKEPHFVAGRGRVNGMDYRGAVESFQKALEVNPRSASAHFELGWLLEEKEKDFAGAIYHYESFLKLRPRDEKTDQLGQRIINCKQELARTVTLGPVNKEIQNKLERLSEENGTLRKQVESLTAQLAAASARPVAADKTNASTAPAPVPAPAPVAVANPTPTNRPPSAQKNLALASGGTTAPPVALASGLTHVIKAGDTPAALARKYGMSLNALMTANPGLDPKKLRIGQVINIPSK